MTLIDFREDFGDTAVESACTTWFDAVDGGTLAVLQLAGDPDYDSPEQIVRDALTWAEEIGDWDRREELLAAGNRILDELDTMGPEERARMLTDAADTAEMAFARVAGYPAGGAA